MADRPLDLVVKNVRVVRPGRPEVERLDLGVKDGRFARIAPDHPAARRACRSYDARGRLGFPGVVDAHTHVGIYGPLADDAVSESRAAVSGGVTTMLTYFRTGQYYLNRGGAYAEFFPEVLRLSEGRYHCDYAYHLAPIASATWTRWSAGRRSTACPRSRSSCSTAAMGCTAGRPGRAAPLPDGRPEDDLRPRALRVHPAGGRADARHTRAGAST